MLARLCGKCVLEAMGHVGGEGVGHVVGEMRYVGGVNVTSI